MTIHTFPAGLSPQVLLAGCAGKLTIVYGDGAAQLDLTVGGNLTIREA
jgi:hypothetical protein